MEKIFVFLKARRNVTTHYCPGCTHGIIHRMLGFGI